MRKVSITFLFFLFFSATLALADLPNISVTPETIIQGEPIMVTLESLSKISLIKSAKFDGQKINFFLYKSKPTAFIGIDLNKKPDDYDLIVTLSNGQILKKTIIVGKREKVEVPLGIPEKLGGNATTSQKIMVSSLAKENALLAGLFTNKKSLWTEDFRFPLDDVFVTDKYGYSRKTGEYSLSHRGVDLRAEEGTKVFAMNRGVVRVVREGRNYGKTVVIDHGMGLMTFYLHLSKIKVYEGQLVQKGQLLGLSGQTGYVLGSHLHLSIRINNISIDPMKFMGFFK